jgi:hypothetical protein
MRFLSGRAASVSHTFLNDEDVITVPSVSVDVWRNSDPSTYVTQVTNITPVNGVYTVTIPNDKATQGVYTARWTGTGYQETSSFEIVGGFLFTVPQARAGDVELEDTARFPAADIRGYREVIEAEFERITGRSFTPRTAIVEFQADGTDTAYVGLHDCAALVALSGPNGALTVADYHLDDSGLLSGLQSFCEGDRLTAVIDYGFRVVPDDVARVGILRLRTMLAAERSGVPDRAVTFVAAEGGNFTLATAGRSGWETGIPEVDATLSRYTYRILRDVLGAG